MTPATFVTHTCGHSLHYPAYLVKPATEPCYDCRRASKAGQAALAAAAEAHASLTAAFVAKGGTFYKHDENLLVAPSSILLDALDRAIERGIDVEAKLAAYNEEEETEENDW